MQKKQTARLHELAEYLWDNYIDMNESSQVFIIGVGQAYEAVVHLLNSRTSDVIKSVKGIVNFVTTTLHPISAQVLDEKPKWYRQNSLVIVSHCHNVWSLEHRKQSKRYGSLIQAEFDGLNDMLVHNREQVQAFILDRIQASAAQ